MFFRTYDFKVNAAKIYLFLIRKFVGSEVIFSDEKLEIIKTFLNNKTLRNAAKGLSYYKMMSIKIIR